MYLRINMLKMRQLVAIPRRSRCVVIVVLLVIFQLCSILIYSATSGQSEHIILTQLDNFDFTKARTFVNDWFKSTQEDFNKVLDKKLSAIDLSDKAYWKFQNELTDTALTMPVAQATKKQRLLQFDPRLTYSVYINHMKQAFLSKNPQNDNTLEDDSKKVYVPFQWSDWVDLTLLNQYIVMPESEKPDCEFVLKPDAPARGKRAAPRVDPKGNCIPNKEISQEYLVQNNIKDTSLLPGFNMISSGPKGSLAKKRMQAKSYVYSTLPNPSSILFLSDDGIYEVFTDKRQYLRSSEMYADFVNKNAVGGTVVFDPVKEFRELTSQVPAQNFAKPNETFDELLLADKDLRLPLDSSMFEYDYTSIMAKYKNMPKLTSKQQAHFDALKYSSSIASMRLTKHFKEAALDASTPSKESGAHYDWRFFNGFVSLSALNEMDDVAEKKRIILHRLLRNWLQFTYKTNVITWIAHGSLLSWYWDGISFPWDVDIDVQMPIMELDRFALMFNNSLVVENVNEGFGKFYLDCSSFLTHRTKGNGRNNIDARFVDVDSGFYIDITGLSLTNTQVSARYKGQIDDDKVEELIQTQYGAVLDEKPAMDAKGRKAREQAVAKSVSVRLAENQYLQAYNCRNNHFYLLKELSPLRVSLIEGTKTLVPNNFKDILKAEYTRGMSVTTFNKHVYLPQIRLWLPFETIYKSLKEEVETIHAATARKPSKNNRVTAAKIIKLMKAIDESMILKLLQDEDILKEYYLTHEITALHQQELDSILNDKITREFLVDQVVNTESKPIRKDMFYFTQQVGNGGEIRTVLKDEDELFNEIYLRVQSEKAEEEPKVEDDLA